MKSTLTILFLIIINTVTFSQGITIKGVVVDENGNKLKDVNIREKKAPGELLVTETELTN